MEGWREKLLTEPDFENRLYAEAMVHALKDRPKEKTPPSTKQAASTLRILERDPALDEDWFHRPDPANAVIAPKDWIIREISEEEWKLLGPESELKRNMNRLGQPETSSVGEDKRQIAMNAYDYAMPMKEEPRPSVETKESWFNRFLSSFRFPTFHLPWRKDD